MLYGSVNYTHCSAMSPATRRAALRIRRARRSPLLRFLQSFGLLIERLLSVLKPFFESNVKLRIEIVVLRMTVAALMSRNAKPRFTNADRVAIVLLSKCYNIKKYFVLKTATLTRWHRLGYRLLWRWKSRPPGQPPIPEDLQKRIQEVISKNPGIGQKASGEHPAHAKRHPGLATHSREVLARGCRARKTRKQPTSRFTAVGHIHPQ